MAYTIIPLDESYAPVFACLSLAALAETPQFWPASYNLKSRRTAEFWHECVEPTPYNRAFGVLAGGELVGKTRAYAIPGEQSWVFGGTYVVPAHRGPIAQLDSRSLVDHLYDMRFNFVFNSRLALPITAYINKGNIISRRAALRNGLRPDTHYPDKPQVDGSIDVVIGYTAPFDRSVINQRKQQKVARRCG